MIAGSADGHPENPLRAFEAAARHGSVSSAASELNVAHGAISHQIRALEAALKVSLLRRGKKAAGDGRA